MADANGTLIKMQGVKKVFFTDEVETHALEEIHLEIKRGTYISIYENVELPLTYRGTSSSERKQKVQNALERVGMAHRLRHYPSQLSGGQQQRVAVARALVGDPLILMADEPTGNLDSKNGEAVMELLRDLHRNGATICMVTHDQRYANFAERTIHLFDGRIVEETQEARVGAN